jgi:glycosyltransferase involved in cell wall biosynthesis
MVCLVTIPWFHPAYKAGGPIVSIANMTEQFTEKISYRIYTSNKDLDGKVLDVPVNTWVNYNDNTQVWYSSKGAASLSAYKNFARELHPDILFITGIYSLPFNLIPLMQTKTRRKIVSARGMLHPGALSQKRLKKKIYIFMWKLTGLHRKCLFHASTAEEEKFIKNIFGLRTKVFVAQNFPRVIKKQPVPMKQIGAVNLVSIALISPMKNILPVIKALINCNGNITYNIYGPVKDNSYWASCCEKIKELPPNIQVNYHGDIPPLMVSEALAANHVFILPSKSENFGHAIYEALTAGKPVITSNYTPWNNLEQAKAGFNIDPDMEDSIVKAINLLAGMDSDEFAQWSEGANRYASAAINITEIKQQYHEMFLS